MQYADAWHHYQQVSWLPANHDSTRHIMFRASFVGMSCPEVRQTTTTHEVWQTCFQLRQYGCVELFLPTSMFYIKTTAYITAPVSTMTTTMELSSTPNLLKCIQLAENYIYSNIKRNNYVHKCCKLFSYTRYSQLEERFLLLFFCYSQVAIVFVYKLGIECLINK